MNNKKTAKAITKRLAQQKRQQINKIVDSWKENKMNDCMGSNFYPDSHNHYLRINPDWHGKFGHSNVGILDHDSYVTGKGKHDRCHASIDVETGNLELTVDDRWKLGEPSKTQMLKIARADGWNGRWKFDSSDSYEFKGNTVTIYTFTK